MIEIFNGNHWKPARGTPEPITKGRHKGKYRVLIFTGNPEHPQGLSQIIIAQDDMRGEQDEQTGPETHDKSRLLIIERTTTTRMIQMELFKSE